ncbi:hypothetical protein ACJX0J_016782, partial [Zea mays]
MGPSDKYLGARIVDGHLKPQDGAKNPLGDTVKTLNGMINLAWSTCAFSLDQKCIQYKWILGVASHGRKMLFWLIGILYIFAHDVDGDSPETEYPNQAKDL